MSSVRSALYVGAVALLVALLPWGDHGMDSYYSILRFLICGICAFGAYLSLRESRALEAARSRKPGSPLERHQRAQGWGITLFIR